MAEICNWDEVDIVWNEVDTVWNECIQILGGVRGAASGDWSNFSLHDLVLPDDDEEKRKKKKLAENTIKVLVTMYNHFITPENQRLLEMAKVYPTFQEKKEINEAIKVELKNSKNNFIDPTPEITRDKIKQGLTKIIDYVESNS